jgi:hypothetical protein
MPVYFRHSLMQRIEARIDDLYAGIWSIRLGLINRWRRTPITRAGGPIVSLTTYGKRLRTVHLTIESIARGNMLPSRLILWLDDEAVFKSLPAPLRRLADRGLEVKLCKNYGPHAKYYPYVESEASFQIPVIIADDDILYPRSWVEGLVRASREYPGVINCYLAKKIELSNNGIDKYSKWQICKETIASLCNVAHGVNGVIFPASYMATLKQAGNGFVNCCPTADDIWLHLHAIRAGYRVRQILPRARRFHAIPGTQEYGLWVSNNKEGNDRQVGATYLPRDVELLRREWGQAG